MPSAATRMDPEMTTLSEDRSKKSRNCGDGIWDLWVTGRQVPPLSSITLKTPPIQCGFNALPVDDEGCERSGHSFPGGILAQPRCEVTVKMSAGLQAAQVQDSASKLTHVAAAALQQTGFQACLGYRGLHRGLQAVPAGRRSGPRGGPLTCRAAGASRTPRVEAGWAVKSPARRRRLKRARNPELGVAQGAQGTLRGGASRPRKGKAFRGEGSGEREGLPDTPRGPARAGGGGGSTASARLPRRRPSGPRPRGETLAPERPRAQPLTGAHAQWRGGGVSEEGPAVGGGRVGGARRKRRRRGVGGPRVGGAPAELPARG
uniref:Uncharacterized protein n=1 Tax=Rangifer tarandus platyrhynchus TaxID=3082113 RepID=A0ACB0EVR1_RANTA|nr:unnamed protein product [Rangifer tarandus platyrhynchus]